MASFTIELRALVETFGDDVINWFSSYDLKDYLNDEQITALNKFGFSKEKLAKKIIQHYYFREIGFETPTYFAHQAQVFMQEIMEEKAPLLYAKTQLINPIYDTNVTEVFSGESSSTSENTNTNKGSGLTVNQNTPQGQINKQTILNGTYASSTSANEGESENKDNGKSSGNQDYIKTIRGNQKKSPIQMMAEYQRYTTAIEKDIIDRAGCLFMNVYNRQAF